MKQTLKTVFTIFAVAMLVVAICSVTERLIWDSVKVVPQLDAQVIAPGTTYVAQHISSNGTTTVSTSRGVLHSISINTKGASSNVLTVYDGTAATGAVLAVIDTTLSVGTISYDVQFSTNLTIVSATGTAADVTVSYRKF